MSPMGILRESPSPNDAKWFEENMHDFSLSSFLGHLDAACDQNAAVAAAASAAAARRCRSPNRCVSSNTIAISVGSMLNPISCLFLIGSRRRTAAICQQLAKRASTTYQSLRNWPNR